MDYLQENIKFYGIEVAKIQRDDSLFIKEEVISEYSLDTNRALYLFYRNQDIEFVKEIIEKSSVKSIVLYFYTENEDLQRIFSYIPLEKMKDKIQFLKVDFHNASGFKEIENTINYFFYSFSKIYPIIAYRDDLEYLQDAKALMKFIREKKENHIFLLGNDIDDTLYGIENRLMNMKHHSNHPGIQNFKEVSNGSYKNRPAIIVSSGPSLDKNVHLLKDYQDKALILSCDGSYTTLLKKGIKPHFIGSVERVYRTYEAFYKEREFEKDLLLIAPAVVRKEIVEKFEGNTLSVFKDKDAFGGLIDKMLMEEKGKLWCGSSVAHLLFSFAEYLECSPIILIGQDLSYDMDGVSHAGDSEVKEQALIKEAKVWLKGNYVDKVPSTPIWEKFLITFRELVHDSKAKVINATEGGAYIEGAEINTLENTLNEYCGDKIIAPIQLYKQINEFNRYEDIKDNVKVVYQEFFDKFYELFLELDIIFKKNKQAIERFNKGINTQKQLDRIYDVLDETEELVKKMAVDRMLMMVFQYPIYLAISQISHLDEQSYTMTSLAVNLESHFNMINTILFNTKRMLKILANQAQEQEIEIKGVEKIYWKQKKEFDIIRN